MRTLASEAFAHGLNQALAHVRCRTASDAVASVRYALTCFQRTPLSPKPGAPTPSTLLLDPTLGAGVAVVERWLQEQASRDELDAAAGAIEDNTATVKGHQPSRG